MNTRTVRYLTINQDQAGQRIDNFLITALKGVPKTHIYRILRKGEVRINKKRIKPHYRLQADDQLRLPPVECREAPAKATPGRQLRDFLAKQILFEDKSFLIMNKPSGIPVHGGSGVSQGLIEALQVMYPKLPQLELVHRLDRDTSGCLILAKRRSILREMHELLREGQVTKIYWALTRGHWRPEECKVAVSLVKNKLSSGERMVKVQADGKPSLTVFKPLQQFNRATFVEAQLFTGRTHQIRVHAQYSGHPLAGDPKYGDKLFNNELREVGLRRLFLHAARIQFVLPSSGARIEVNAPLAPELQAVLEALETMR